MINLLILKNREFKYFNTIFFFKKNCKPCFFQVCKFSNIYTILLYNIVALLPIHVLKLSCIIKPQF